VAGSCKILLVAHGKTTGLAGALLSGATDPRTAATSFIVDHGAVTQWRESGDSWNLLLNNNSRHLTD
jgi:broad specificity phosphatase PhoE